jgi:hypothetical protein
MTYEADVETRHLRGEHKLPHPDCYPCSKRGFATTIPGQLAVEVNFDGRGLPFSDERLLILTTPCYSYQELRSLPKAISYDGTRLGLASYNSDTDRACYRSDKLTATIIG